MLNALFFNKIQVIIFQPDLFYVFKLLPANLFINHLFIHNGNNKKHCLVNKPYPSSAVYWLFSLVISEIDDLRTPALQAVEEILKIVKIYTLFKLSSL